MSGSTWGGAIGFAVGSVFGMGQVGWMIGSAIGGYIDPTRIEGPRLTDARSQTSRDGIPIPFGWGVFPVMGNVIWQQPDITEHENEQSGKGGGTEQVTYTYTRSYAIGICEGPITGLLQIRRNGKLVYDARDDATLEEEYTRFGLIGAAALERITGQRAENARFMDHCVVYLGDETQGPDPTIEGYLGVGNVPSYRGLAYIVVTDDETNAGEIAQYEFVVAACGTVTPGTSVDDSPFTFMALSDTANVLYTSEAATSWTDSVGSVFGASLVFTYGTRIVACYSNSAQVTDDFGATPFAALPNWPSASISKVVVTDSGRVYGLVQSGTNATVYVADDIEGPWTSVALGIPANFIAGHDGCIIAGGANSYKVSLGGGSFGSTISTGFTCEGIRYSGGLFLFCGGGSSNLHRWSEDNGATLTTATLPAAAGQFIDAARMPDGSWISIHKSGVANTTDNVCRSPDGKTDWAFVTTPSCKFESNDSPLIGVNGNTVFAAAMDGTGLFYPIVSADSGATWTHYAHGYGFTASSATSVAVIPDLADTGTPMPDAPGYYVDESGVLTGPSGDTVAPCTPTLGDIVADLCDREGLTSDEYDVSELTDLVPGFVVARETDAASVIGALTTAYFFDPGEWDGKLRFVKRGGTSVAAINGDDLVERDGDAFERERVQEAELLRRVTIGYVDPAANYGPTTQKWERRAGTVQARGEASFEVPVTLEADDAATIAKRRGLTAWGEPEKQKFSLPYRLSALTPTDIITYTDADGEVHTLRIMQAEDDSGIRYMEAATNCAEAYNATATGVTPKPPTISEANLIGPTQLVVMDLPLWRNADADDLGLYAAARGYFNGWTGAQADISTDSGTTYTQSVQFTSEATIGYTTTALTAWVDSETPEEQSVTVYLPDAPSSVSYEALLQYANKAAVQLASGAWEILQYQTVTALGNDFYTLSGLVRGRFNTTPGAVSANATFVLLNDAVQFFRAERDSLGQTLTMRATSYGTSSDAAVPFDFDFTDGVSQTEWPVHDVEASRDGSDNVTVTWIGRARRGTETSPYHSTHFTGYRVTYSDGESYDVGTTTTTHTRSSAPASQTITVSPLNDITGAGPASAGVTV